MTTTPPLSSYVPLQGEIGRPGSKVKNPSPPVYIISPCLSTCPWICLPPLLPLMWLAYQCALRHATLVSVAGPHDSVWSHLLSSVMLPLATSVSPSFFCLFCSFLLFLGLAPLASAAGLRRCRSGPSSSTPLLHFNLPKCFLLPVINHFTQQWVRGRLCGLHFLMTGS